MKYKNVILVGTSHIAKESVENVEKVILEEKPDLVCLELDNKRLAALLSKKKKSKMPLKEIFRIGLKGYLFSVIGSYVQEKLGEKVGITPGSDMLAAFKTAKKNNIRVALIDQDIELTLKKFSKSITWKEKGRFAIDIIKGLLFKKQVLTFDLTKVPEEELIHKLIEQVKERYPNAHRVLVEERNILMAKEISKFSKTNPDKKIIAVIGAGHEKEMVRLIKKYTNNNVDIINTGQN
ncbi:TraB/GumN family protein [Candidatus Woesearchaeota archaeon]|nr:TraB/GumN family protein [Candidatus Woesearchaeota archaeon]